jgi:ubiquinone/menaquinone biosynthesis C-methylase UbiE
MKSEEEYFAQRDSDIQSNWGTNELIAFFNEIDDARTIKDNPKVLEVGCGSGMGMIRLKETWKEHNQTDLNIKGLDISDYAVDVCKKRGLDAIVGNAEELPFEKDEFDIIIGQHVLEHTDMEKTLNDSLRVAKKAIFIIPIGPSIDNNDRLSDFEETKDYQKRFYHTRIITDESLEELLKKVPNERHKVIKDIVKYIYSGVEHKNYMIVLYRQIKKIKEVKKDDS